MRSRTVFLFILIVVLSVLSGCAASGVVAGASPQQTTGAPTEAPTTAPTEAPTTVPTEPQQTTVALITEPQQTVDPSTLSQYPEVPGMINTPYEYPVVPGTPEWAEYSKPELLKLCAIPEEVYTTMTTPALLESVLDYPYMADIIAYTPPYRGFELLARGNSVLKELLQRPDLVEVLETFDIYQTKMTLSPLSYKMSIAETALECIKEWLKNNAANE